MRRRRRELGDGVAWEACLPAEPAPEVVAALDEITRAAARRAELTRGRETETTPTWASRTDSPPYHVVTRIDGHFAGRDKITDPFVRQRVTVGWLDVLRAALHRRRLVVEVFVGARWSAVEDVLELDANYRGQPGTARRKRCEAELNGALAAFADVTEGVTLPPDAETLFAPGAPWARVERPDAFDREIAREGERRRTWNGQPLPADLVIVDDAGPTPDA